MNTEENKVSWRHSKKVRLYVIGGFLLVVVVLGIIFESLRWWMVGIGVVLLSAFGLEMTNTDVDLGTMIETVSIKDAVIERDEAGNLKESTEGGFMTRILRDKAGNEVPAGTTGAKYTDEYNCDDFTTQPEAQTFFDKAGGVGKDTNRLDGDKDGEACESLPKGARTAS